jgi:hypothetical protein
MKSLIIIKAFLLAFILFMQGCGDEKSAPKPQTYWKQYGSWSSQGNLFKEFVRKVNENKFSNDYMGTYQYKYFKHTGTSVVKRCTNGLIIKKNRYCFSTIKQNYDRDYITRIVSSIRAKEIKVDGHEWGTSGKVHDKIKGIVNKVWDAYTKSNGSIVRFMGYGSDYDLLDYDNNTLYRISLEYPLGANPMGKNVYGSTGKIVEGYEYSGFTAPRYFR